MFDVVGIGLNAIDYLVGLPRFPVPGEKLRMSSFAREGGGQIFSPPIRVEAVDTTGAGDVFHAGFLYALLEGLTFREILAFANTAAGLSCRGMGGRAAIPTIEAIRAETLPPGVLRMDE